MCKGFPCFHSPHTGRNSNLPFLKGKKFPKQDKILMTDTSMLRLYSAFEMVTTKMGFFPCILKRQCE